jgi:hypothetical protein
MKGPFHRDHLDLTEISHAEIGISWIGGSGPAYHMELRLDSATGKKIADIEADGNGVARTPVLPVNDGGWHKLYIVGSKKDPEAKDVPVASWYIRLLNR